MKKFFVYFSFIVLLTVVSKSQYQGDWEQTNGPFGGTILFLAISGNNIFAGTYGGGVYLSTDNGSNWTQTGLTNTWVYSLAISGNYIFAGTYGGGVFTR